MRNLLQSETGATMVEYGLMVALIALVGFLAVTALGIQINGIFENVPLLNALS